MAGSIWSIGRGSVVWVKGKSLTRLGLVLEVVGASHLVIRIPEIGVLRIKRKMVRPVRWSKCPRQLWSVLLSPVGK